MTDRIPAEVLEQRAQQQRHQLHESMLELRSSLQYKLDVRRNARRYLLPASGVAAMAALALGYGFGGIFTRDQG